MTNKKTKVDQYLIHITYLVINTAFLFTSGYIKAKTPMFENRNEAMMVSLFSAIMSFILIRGVFYIFNHFSQKRTLVIEHQFDFETLLCVIFLLSIFELFFGIPITIIKIISTLIFGMFGIFAWHKALSDIDSQYVKYGQIITDSLIVALLFWG
ncbi:hypothetical protein [Pediococcus acidilactici]|uniref:hypothetical protein n=1 Tax=Pediococcus acidilactici TaxID=1254 RepID=UPI001BD52F8D|nr:hypothetical protein [Pediococcus acidilactici]MBS9400071.1 hypothetical protein [Pediococcus acidilactici]